MCCSKLWEMFILIIDLSPSQLPERCWKAMRDLLPALLLSPVLILAKTFYFFYSVCTLGASLGNQREQPGYVWGMRGRSKDQFPSLDCREHGLEVSLMPWELAVDDSGVQPLPLDWRTFTFLSDQTFPQKAEMYKNVHVKTCCWKEGLLQG